MTHDQLQYRSFWWLWNNYPEYRQLFWGTFNDIKQTEKILGPIGEKRRQVILSKMKSLGMVKGILDFMFFYDHVLYVIDFKVGNDRLSKEQKAHIAQIESQGGKAYTCSTEKEFQEIIHKIIL
jgi:ATP-dependent exoDNAse (exonuclease V) beta subunit